MPEETKSELSVTQQSMLDLALGCDLKVSEPARLDAIRSRHRAIKTQQDAANYIREVENKIHSRRKFTPAKSQNTAAAMRKTVAKPRPLTGSQTASAIFTLVIFMVAAGWFAPNGVNLVLVAASMVAMLIVLGISTTNRALGVLINEQNLMSLSRFQMALWTVIILSAYMTYALIRIKWMAGEGQKSVPITDPLAIIIDWHLWALLGISTTSLVGSPLILSTKKDQEPVPSTIQKTAQMTGESPEDVNADKQGTLYANPTLSDARLTDMFEGDELSNTARLDLAKVQMFYFTIIAALCFFVMVFESLGTQSPVDLKQLPLLPDGFVAILGISHAGYLASKGINHTPSQT